MGDHHDGQPSALPVHAVWVDPFLIDVYEVSNQQYADALNWAYSHRQVYFRRGKIYGASDRMLYCNTRLVSPTSGITCSDRMFIAAAGREDHPMVEVTWYGAAAYANWRSAMQGLETCYDLSTWECDFSKNGHRLPTEAEWEYAARGGEHDPYYRYSWGDSIDGSKANYWDSGDQYEAGEYPWTTPVGYYDGGQKPPGWDMANGYGLYDMAGNVWEWCNDYYGEEYYSDAPYDNPRGPSSGDLRVLRGGSWGREGGSLVRTLRSSRRFAHTPLARPYNFGLRLARTF
jgi:formylglycine-generating enzyme required for sulfatase activity